MSITNFRIKFKMGIYPNTPQVTVDVILISETASALIRMG